MRLNAVSFSFFFWPRLWTYRIVNLSSDFFLDSCWADLQMRGNWENKIWFFSLKESVFFVFFFCSKIKLEMCVFLFYGVFFLKFLKAFKFEDKKNKESICKLIRSKNQEKYILMLTKTKLNFSFNRNHFEQRIKKKQP